MDFQLKLTFTGKSHKNDPDSRSHISLETLFIRRIGTLTIRVQTAIRQLKMEENSVKTLKFAVFKNGGKLEKTVYTGSVRSPKTERAPSQPENHSTCPKAQRAGVRSPKTERIPPQENYCPCLWAQSAQLIQLINHNRHDCWTCPRTQRVLQLLLENYHTYLKRLRVLQPKLRKFARKNRGK